MQSNDGRLISQLLYSGEDICQLYVVPRKLLPILRYFKYHACSHHDASFWQGKDKGQVHRSSKYLLAKLENCTPYGRTEYSKPRSKFASYVTKY